MKKLLFLVSSAVALVGYSAAPKSSASSVLDDFRTPPVETKPWTYWLWENTCVTEESIREELADIKRLGFGAVLLSDSRGYWDDENHVVKPKPKVSWASDEWLDLVAKAIREASRQNLKVALNVAASGGHLKADWDTGADGPKFLYARRYLPGDAFEAPELPHYRDVAIFAVRTQETPERGNWELSGDGFLSMEGNYGKRELAGTEFRPRLALETRELRSAAEGKALGEGWTILRFGAATIKGRETDVDVLDDAPVNRHLDRVIGRLLARIPELSGADRTFAYLYNVSWEGAMPTWGAPFEADFRKIAGYELRPLMPILAGFDSAAKPRAELLRDFRHARGVMMSDHLYGAVRRWAHAHGLLAFSESGGPWGKGEGARNPATFGECDQLAYLGANDFPQGEFWPLKENCTSPECGHAGCNGRFFTRGIVSAAHIYGGGIASVEAFTHMHRHWTVDPAFLKPLGDIAFALGINRFVWHTYTASPRSFGVPGLEYFAGSHINRNVTWNRDLPAFITYLHRCQALLQRGEPVTDVALLCGDRPYAGWARKENGFLTRSSSWEERVTVPKGYASDLVNDEALARDPKLLQRYAVVCDCRPESARGKCVNVGKLQPDVETDTDWQWCHRRDTSADWYFIAGEGQGELVFRASAPQVLTLDPVSGAITRAEASKLADGRTRVRMDLPVAGSRFVVFLRHDASPADLVLASRERERGAVAGPWQVSFAYHDGVAAAPPAPVELSSLLDFTTRDDLKHFSGTAVYRTKFSATAPKRGERMQLAIGKLPSGLARVLVNGKDCGVVWCAPWVTEVTGAIREGENELEIRYTNNWANRLIGDCALPPDERVTRCGLRYWQKRRVADPKVPGGIYPTVFSGFTDSDPLQPSGLLGPVELVVSSPAKP